MPTLAERRSKPPIEQQVAAQIRQVSEDFYRRGYWDHNAPTPAGHLSRDRLKIVIRADVRSRALPFISVFRWAEYRSPQQDGTIRVSPNGISISFTLLRRMSSLVSALMLVDSPTFSNLVLGREISFACNGDKADAMAQILEQSEQVEVVRAAGRGLYPNG